MIYIINIFFINSLTNILRILICKILYLLMFYKFEGVVLNKESNAYVKFSLSFNYKLLYELF